MGGRDMRVTRLAVGREEGMGVGSAIYRKGIIGDCPALLKSREGEKPITDV